MGRGGPPARGSRPPPGVQSPLTDRWEPPPPCPLPPRLGPGPGALRCCLRWRSLSRLSPPHSKGSPLSSSGRLWRAREGGGKSRWPGNARCHGLQWPRGIALAVYSPFPPPHSHPPGWEVTRPSEGALPLTFTKTKAKEVFSNPTRPGGGRHGHPAGDAGELPRVGAPPGPATGRAKPRPSRRPRPRPPPGGPRPRRPPGCEPRTSSPAKKKNGRGTDLPRPAGEPRPAAAG